MYMSSLRRCGCLSIRVFGSSHVAKNFHSSYNCHRFGATKFTSAIVLSNNFYLSSCLNSLVHDRESQLFIYKLNEGHDDATVTYKKNGSILDLEHLVIPDSAQGKGLGKVVAKAVLDYCVEHDQKIIISCDYMQKYYKDHPLPEYQKIVIELE